MRAAAAMRAVAPASGPPEPARPAPAEPSWVRVLATTIRLSVLRAPAGRRWRLAGLGVVAVVVAAAAAGFAGVFTGAVPARAPAAGRSPATAARAAAAAWIATQVGSDAMVACDPGMCAALADRGVTPGRLVLLRRPGGVRGLGPGIIVAAASIPGGLARQYAPALIAGFGAGRARIDVRATVPHGAAAYAAALRADLAARRSAGSQLLRNERLRFTARAAAQLRTGQVDSRLLVTLAAMSARYALRVTAFGDASPGAPVLFRDIVVTRGGGAAGLAAVRGMANAQGSPYLPARTAIIRSAAGPAALRIQFAAPSPLGLLTQVLVADPQRPPGRAGALARARARRPARST
jgi:hypothetical protein